MNQQEIIGLEYSSKILGFHPLSFIDDVINAANDYLCDIIEAMKEYFENKKENLGINNIKKEELELVN